MYPRRHGSPYADPNFIETLLHEQVHAVVYHQIGADDRRRELEWLHELGAIITSQHALGRAAADMRDQALRQEVRAHVQWSRRTYAYGDLATQVLRDTRSPEIGWNIWRRIIAAGRIPKQDYACRHHLVPLLREAGWPAELPYRYGEKTVDALDCAQERWIL